MSGNQLEARRLPSPHWYRLWLDVWQLRGSELRGWADTIRIIYDRETRQSRNVEGVETRVPGWGGTESVEYLGECQSQLSQYRNVACPDPSWSAWVLGNVGDYMHQLVEYFVSLGYQRGQTIRSERERGKYFPYENA